MIRFLLLPLLTVGLLVCPLRCVPGMAGVQPETGAVAAICSCCGPLVAESPGLIDEDLDRGAPGPAGEDCDCINCICNGAVLESGGVTDSVQDAADGMAADHRVVSWSEFAQGAQFAESRRAEGYSSGYFSSGRTARIAHQSLLI